MPGSVRVATDREFPDLNLLRAWLAPTIAQNAGRPWAVQVQIVHTTLGAFYLAWDSSYLRRGDGTPIYAVELTGTTFVCPCGAPRNPTGRAMHLAWNPTIHYPATVSAGPRMDLRALGVAYALDVGTRPCPRRLVGLCAASAAERRRRSRRSHRLDHARPHAAGGVHSARQHGSPHPSAANALGAVQVSSHPGSKRRSRP